MSKKGKILLILIVVSLSLVIYLIISSKPVIIKPDVNTAREKITGSDGSKVGQVDLQKLEDSYKEVVGAILADFERLIEEFKITSTTSPEQEFITATTTAETKDQQELSEKVSTLRNQLMEVKVPTEFKDLHLNLLLALNKIDSYLDDRNEEEGLAGLDLISQAKINYEWLSNNANVAN
jgi:hypothetical protein